MEKDAITQPEGLSLLDNHLADFSPGQCLAPEGIGHEKAVVPSMKPTGAEVLRIGKESDTDALSLDRTAEVAPLRRLAPHLFLVRFPCARANLAAVLDKEKR